MAFEGLSQKLTAALSRFTGRGKLTEQTVKEGVREVRVALLEADVNYLVVKDFCKRITDRCVVLNYGRKLCDGTYREIAANAEVQEAYLGQS